MASKTCKKCRNKVPKLLIESNYIKNVANSVLKLQNAKVRASANAPPEADELADPPQLPQPRDDPGRDPHDRE
jgi:hypothetical protein